MTSVLGLLDDPPDGSDADLRRVWLADVERSLTKHSQEWRAAVSLSEDPAQLSKDRAWSLLGWVEDVASLVVDERRPSLVEDAAFAMSLLEASPLDRRDVMLVGALVRRGADLAGLDFRALVTTGCHRAGVLGEQCLTWLLTVSDTTPATHEEVGEGTSFRFRRKPSDIDVNRLEKWLRGDG